MNCIKCNTPNLPEAKFCRNCGESLTPAHLQTKTDDQTIKALLVIIGLDYLSSTVMFVIQKFVIPSMLKNDGMSNVDLIFKYFGWTSDILALGAMLFFMLTLKNNTVKTALIVFIILRLIFMIGYRFLPLSM